MGELSIAEHVLKYRDVIDARSLAVAKPMLREAQQNLRKELESVECTLGKEADPCIQQIVREYRESVQKRLAQINEAQEVSCSFRN